MMPESEILRDLWYMAVPGQQLKRGQMLGKILLGQSLVLGRDANGEVSMKTHNSCSSTTPTDRPAGITGEQAPGSAQPHSPVGLWTSPAPIKSTFE